MPTMRHIRNNLIFNKLQIYAKGDHEGRVAACPIYSQALLHSAIAAELA